MPPKPVETFSAADVAKLADLPAVVFNPMVTSGLIRQSAGGGRYLFVDIFVAMLLKGIMAAKVDSSCVIDAAALVYGTRFSDDTGTYLVISKNVVRIATREAAEKALRDDPETVGVELYTAAMNLRRDIDAQRSEAN